MKFFPLLGSFPSSFRFNLLSTFAAFVAMAISADAQTVSVVQTNADQSALLSPQPSLTFVPGTGGTLNINVDDTVRYQRSMEWARRLRIRRRT